MKRKDYYEETYCYFYHHLRYYVSFIILIAVLLTLILSACHTFNQNSKGEGSMQKENSQEETSVDNNIDEESVSKTSSDQVSMWTDESDEIYTVSFPMSESEHAAVYDI